MFIAKLGVGDLVQKALLQLFVEPSVLDGLSTRASSYEKGFLGRFFEPTGHRPWFWLWLWLWL
jgi:hypothetical protein